MDLTKALPFEKKKKRKSKHLVEESVKCHWNHPILLEVKIIDGRDL